MDAEPGVYLTYGSDQGLAGGLGEGQDPWLSKLAVLAFHCKKRHMENTAVITALEIKAEEMHPVNCPYWRDWLPETDVSKVTL